MKTEKELHKILDQKLKDFSPDDEANEHWTDPNAGKVVKVDKKPAPYIVFIIFVHLKKYEFGGRWEKVAWEIPIKYKGISMMLAHKKFGFSIRTYSDTIEDGKLAQEAIYKINKSIPTAEKLVEPLIKSQVNAGAITLDNDYTFLRSRYEYFREKSIEHLHIELNGGEDSNIDMEEILNSGEMKLDFRILKGKAASYIAAMADAYFSLLEHILVLLLPFTKETLCFTTLSKFIGSNWGEKYKILFDIKDREIKKHFDTLRDIKEIYRNPLAHGNFRKEGHSLYVHFPNVGAIPMKLTQSNSIKHFSFYNLKEVELNYICESFDLFDSFLEKRGAKYGMIYIKNGLSVLYDEETVKSYKNAMNSESSFIEFVNELEQRFENQRNMDW